MFYELDTLDPLGTNPWKRSSDELRNGTFKASLDVFAGITLLVDPQAQLTNRDLVQGDNTTAAAVFSEFLDRTTNNVQSGLVAIPNILPDG